MKKVLSEEDINLRREKRLKYATVALALLAAVTSAALGGYIIYDGIKYLIHKDDLQAKLDSGEAYFEYRVPAGYSLHDFNGRKVGVKNTEVTADIIETVDAYGNSVFTLPDGYHLEFRDGKPVGVKTLTEIIDPQKVIVEKEDEPTIKR